MFVWHISAWCTSSCEHCIKGAIKSSLVKEQYFYFLLRWLLKASKLSVQYLPGFVLMSTLGLQEGKAQLLSLLPTCCGSEWPAKLNQYKDRACHALHLYDEHFMSLFFHMLIISPASVSLRSTSSYTSIANSSNKWSLSCNYISYICHLCSQWL